jgi:hypothetical protein
MLDPKQAIPVEALFAADDINPNPESDPRPALAAADVVLGMDVDSGRQFLLYGRDTLERIVRSGRPGPQRVLLIALDQETDELERVLALLLAVKGRHDYGPHAGPSRR